MLIKMEKMLIKTVIAFCGVIRCFKNWDNFHYFRTVWKFTYLLLLSCNVCFYYSQLLTGLNKFFQVLRGFHTVTD